MGVLGLIIVLFFVVPCLLITASLVVIGLGFAYRKHLPWNLVRNQSPSQPKVSQPTIIEVQKEDPRTEATSTVHQRPLRCRGEFSWLLPPVLVVATFAGIASSDPSIKLAPDPATPVTSHRHSRTRPAVLRGVDPVPTDDRTVAVSAEGLTQRPAWTNYPQTDDGVARYVVLASQQYTTREEAEQELASNATDLLLQDLQKQYPATARQSAWKPGDEDLKRATVKQQYVEVIERDFGTFFHPMYRVWWQIELSPVVRAEFLPSWRGALVANRIRTVGLVCSSLVLLITLATVYYRLDILTNGVRRLQLKIATGGTVLLAVMVGLYLVRASYTIAL